MTEPAALNVVVDMIRDTGEEDAAYAAGWTISGIATLATIVAVWVFAI